MKNRRDALLYTLLLLPLLYIAIFKYAPIILAILLNEVRMARFKKLTQTILYLPHFMSWVIIGGIVYLMFSNSRMVNLCS